MKEHIKTRYEKGWVTDAQLERYVALGAISEADAEEIKSGAKKN